MLINSNDLIYPSLNKISAIAVFIFDAGISTVVLKSSKWSGVKLEYTSVTNTWHVEGTAKYFNADGSQRTSDN